MVLVDGIRPDAHPGTVRRAGEAVLLLGARDERPRPTPTPAAPPLRLSKFHAPEIVFGPDSVREAAHAAVRLGARRPFVVTDPGLVEAGWPSELMAHLREAGLAPQLWLDVTPNPKDHEIEAGFARYVKSECDVVLGIGGGSVIDAAKGRERRQHPRLRGHRPHRAPDPATDHASVHVGHRRGRLPVLHRHGHRAAHQDHHHGPGARAGRLGDRPPAADHHAGGAQRRHRAGRADPRHRGVRLAGPRPAHRPPRAAGRLALQANLERTMVRPGDTAARGAMAQAALEAGLAFTNAILGATHAMSHQAGGMLDLPHGVVNGVLLPHVIRFNGVAVPERFVPIAQAMGLSDVAGTPAEEAVERVAQEVRRLGDEVGVPKGLGDLGVTDADVPRLAQLTLGDACLTTNPRSASAAEVAALFRAAL